LSRALFIGRFQPLHKGHEYAIQYILKREDELIIAIGTTQENYTYRNPLTCGERVEMLWIFLKNRGLLDRCIICSVPDINNNYLWPRHVSSLVPSFSSVYSGNELVLMLFEQSGMHTVRIEEIRKEEYSGTTIRRLIVREKEWRHLVPPDVAKYLDKLGFANRVRRLWRIYGEG